MSTPSSTIENAVRVEMKRQPLPPRERLEQVFDIQDLTAIYGSKPALKDVTMEVYKNLVTAVIGPSGCGKSTFIRCFNRMNDLVPSFSQTGTIRYHGQDISSKDVDPVAVRRTIGMVFQRPNPVPEVDPRQRRLGPEGARHEGRHQGARREGADAGGALGRGQGPAEGRARSGSRAASSSACASRVPSPSSRTSC